MYRQKCYPKLLTAALALFIGCLVCGAPLLSLALTKPKRGLPGRREPAGTRTVGDPRSCFVPNQKPLASLLPKSEVGVTVSKYPTFFWYLPQTSVKTVDFELRDENDKVVYKTALKVTGAPGVVSLKLPTARGVQPLELEKTYFWYSTVNCNPANPEGEIYVGGQIRRVNPSSELVKKLQKATFLDRPAIYAAAGIWHETLTTLADLRRVNPKNETLVRDWIGLLQSVELGEYAREPLIPCCQPSTNQVTSLQN